MADAPRAQSGPNPQHLLATLLGEYFDSTEAPLPAAAVVAVLAEFDISPTSARAALSRLARRGLIAVRSSSRPPTYHLTPEAIARHRNRMEHFLSFGARPRPWTGEWLAVSFSLVEARQAQRHAIRKTLGGLGFVRLYDSLWIAPFGEAEPVSAALDGLLDRPDDRWSVLRLRFHDETGPHGPAAAYDLAGLAAAYQGFIDRFEGLALALRRGDFEAGRALVARTSIMDSWRRFPDLDPELPAHLLPRPWPRAAARELMLEIHAALGAPAAARLADVVAPHWASAKDWITYFSADPQGRPVRADSFE